MQQINTLCSILYVRSVVSCFHRLSILACNTSLHLTLATNGWISTRTTDRTRYAQRRKCMQTMELLWIIYRVSLSVHLFSFRLFFSLSLVPLLLYNSYYVIGNHKQLLSTFLYFHFYDPGMSYTHTLALSPSFSCREIELLPFIHSFCCVLYLRVLSVELRHRSPFVRFIVCVVSLENIVFEIW